MHRYDTLDNLAAKSGQFYVYVTADVTDLDGDDVDGEGGWIDWDWSRAQLHPARNDVRAMVEAGPLDVDPDDDERATLRDAILAAWRDAIDRVEVYTDGGGAYYGRDDFADLSNGKSIRYTLHPIVKFYDKAGWIEATVTDLPTT